MGEIAPLRGGYAFKSNFFSDTGIPVVRISNILSSGLVGGEYVYAKEHKDDKFFSLGNNSILLAMSGATTGKIAVIENETNEKYYQNQRVGYFSKVEGINYMFVRYLVQTNIFKLQLQETLVAGAQPNISSRDIDKFSVKISSNLSEQNMIGDYFVYLDKYIANHQRKPLADLFNNFFNLKLKVNA